MGKPQVNAVNGRTEGIAGNRLHKPMHMLRQTALYHSTFFLFHYVP